MSENDFVRLERVQVVQKAGWQECNVTRVSCATCRWAQAPAPVGYTMLACRRVDQLDSPFLASGDHGYGATLLVAPDFGCVQWEAKDQPAPETT